MPGMPVLVHQLTVSNSDSNMSTAPASSSNTDVPQEHARGDGQYWREKFVRMKKKLKAEQETSDLHKLIGQEAVYKLAELKFSYRELKSELQNERKRSSRLRSRLNTLRSSICEGCKASQG